MATILVVDDRPLNRQFLTTLLGYAGHDTVEAADGLEALEKACAHPPDLAIVDIVMPAMDGYAFVRRLRAEPALADTPVIFYTATYLEGAARKLAESVGVSYVLTKPAEPEVILRTAAEALGLKHHVSPSPPLQGPPEDPLRLLTVDLSSKLEDVIPRLTAMIELGLQLAVERDLDRLLLRVCNGARRIIGARFAAIGVVGEDGRTICRVYHSGGAEGEGVSDALIAPEAGGVIEQIVAGRHPLRVPDLRPYPEAAYFGSLPAQGENWAFLGAPLASAGRLYGVLCLTGKEGPAEFAEEDERIAVTLAAQAGTRYENAKLYHELQEHTSRLQEEIQERARLEAELQRRHDELAEGNRRKDEFLAMLSHELRNPLAGIAGAGALLDQTLAGETDGATARPREVIRRQTAQLARMVDDLLDASRITRGVVQLRKECVDMAGIVRQVEAILRPVMDAQGQQFTVTLPDAPVPLDADPVRLQQVVANLLHNAAKYTEPGGRVWLEVEVTDGNGGVGEWENGRAGAAAMPVKPSLAHSPTPPFPHSPIPVASDATPLRVELRVRDTGVGIAPELLPRVFDMFTQGNRSLARSEGGLGIGLAVARALVELHGGTIQAHSEGVGKGSEFVVHLPLRSGKCAVGSAQWPATPHAPRRTPHSRRILVVDDNADAAEMLAMTLEAEGHEVVAAHSGPAALEMAAGYRPNVVLLDIGMPGMDGYEVARRLRQEPGMTDASLVAVTGYGQEEDRERTCAAGFDEHLVKPVDLDALRRVLQG